MKGEGCLCDNRDDIRCDETHCDIAGPGKPGDANECRVCWLRLNQPEVQPRPLLLGDAVEKMLDAVGITKERSSRWFGTTGCNVRQRKLNKLHMLARQAKTQTIQWVKDSLRFLMGDKDL